MSKTEMDTRGVVRTTATYAMRSRLKILTRRRVAQPTPRGDISPPPPYDNDRASPPEVNTDDEYTNDAGTMRSRLKILTRRRVAQPTPRGDISPPPPYDNDRASPPEVNTDDEYTNDAGTINMRTMSAVGGVNTLATGVLHENNVVVGGVNIGDAFYKIVWSSCGHRVVIVVIGMC
ncbi:hypothetical protein LSAT2_015618 [Lamellibrachia satsuma]|nr:hypothetical protein LSAT2_015618 [Lamellibrachia satsuma]